MFKDILKENGKILLLALGLLIAATIAMISVKSGGYSPTNISENPEIMTFTQAQEVMEEGVDYQAKINTSYGDITVDLFEKETPKTVNNFIFLTGERYYEKVTFHRVIKDFVIQAGDPKGDGTGGPGYTFEDEITDREFEPYVLAMANAGPNTNGSQFFIVSQGIAPENIQALNGGYTIFGKVTSGFAVADSIERVETDVNDKPINDVIIEAIQILEI